MPVAEILAGIALVKSSVEFIKSNIQTCQDISEIGGHIDNLLRGKQELDKKVNNRQMGVKEQFDIAHIAQEAIDAKLAAEKLQEIATLVNLRFGPGTWASILEERARRIKEAKEAQRQARIKAQKESEELWADIKMALMGFGGVIVVVAGVIGAIMYS
jgi:hypothetical protein